MAARVKDIDRGWDALQSRLKSADRSFTKVGIQQGTIRPQEPDEPAGLSDMVQIAVANEFGTDRIPSRPALRNSIDSNKAGLRRITKAISDKIVGNSLGVKEGLALLGSYQMERMRSSIRKLRTPPNKAATVKKKGSSNPLVDTGFYVRSIDHIEVIN